MININRRPLVLAGIELRGVDNPSRIPHFIPASGKRHTSQMGQARVEAFLTRLATDAQVSAARRTRRLAVLLFFYREVLRIDRHDVPDEIPSCHNLG
ncbi:phage integrase N-terminal SAM-like domain-containing protein [Xanthomonas euvesicatoria pv. eucalypti]|uniref:phage integrase N-terminal SAM-like domain-containing protein n=1 Tax=Xanthomonas euvesicatoria TaxID=456327 RepID=UPI0026E387A1|nr:phage integrase N-terminal SAM-like domain-containing protein [Xanthomonas euvesicatoria pv. eucalypti]MDO7935584.1 phage integrase N-terminal SAM-like domain-containing protein [Xanthomonas euvesicatoria pv. eucalypti]MDO7940802.1 phage integrase N-terminal SAM-like domain-containing protein [Xanthomonas euvesicatoria pv. eucalypti]MDO7943388.1 phage integrase N-terminal SAM-like domain-containing protein [Xanthomonas euvesicatoria pv. eucalypti]MDO7949073.1 phage integrase N-terminal SAM-l